MKLGPGEPPVASWRVISLDNFLRVVLDTNARPDGRPWIVAVDGRGAGGKSTLANVLHHAVPASAVVHTDDVGWHYSFLAGAIC